MHNIEPYYRWTELYNSAEDDNSPFFEMEYSEFQFSERIYDHYIHPQWDNMGSSTLFIKVIFADYELGFVVIEMMGEWNDCLHNDIMIFKRNIIEHFTYLGVSKFILVGENVLNFHASDDLYYEEWFDEVDDMDGWICMLDFREHVLDDFKEANIDSYFVLGGKLNDIEWRTHQPYQLFSLLQDQVQKRLGFAGE